MQRCGALREETGGNEWYRYFSYSTVFSTGSGNNIVARERAAGAGFRNTGYPDKAETDRQQDDLRQGLGQDPEGDQA